MVINERRKFLLDKIPSLKIFDKNRIFVLKKRLYSYSNRFQKVTSFRSLVTGDEIKPGYGMGPKAVKRL